MLILGIDPGSRHTGYALVDRQGSKLTARFADRISLSAKAPLPERLAVLSEAIDSIVVEWSPDAVALETLFHGVNSKSLIVLAQARGAIVAQIARHRLPLSEYSPAEVKQSVTGNGRADKTQVAKMVELLLSLPKEKRSSDATDALALAICGAQRVRFEALLRRPSSA